MTERIAVDLDGTLVRTDLLWESAVRHLVHTPLGWARLIRWTLEGPVTLKTRLAERVPLRTDLLPYNEELRDLLDSRREEGADVILATAAARTYAEQIASHVGGFSAVLSTAPAGPNMRSGEKARAIAAHWGDVDWTYVGDSRKDLHVWDSAARAIAVAPEPKVLRALSASGLPTEVVGDRKGSATAWIKQLRIHQWSKNVLVFVPLFTSHVFSESGVGAAWSSILAFLSFSLLASSVYIWNDLNDLDADRRHPRKRRRPIASGAISIPQAVVVGSALAVVALVLAFLVNILFVGALLVYLIATNLYSLWLKRKPMIDVTSLALLYTWRLVAGCAAVLVFPSIWLLAFSTFFFFGLALVKRYAELFDSGPGGSARGYSHPDHMLVMALGVASGLVSVLVFVLYIDSAASTLEYAVPQILWLAVPLLLYWISRLWLVTVRGEMHDDPLVYAVRNKVSLLTLGLVGVVWLTASLSGVFSEIFFWYS